MKKIKQSDIKINAEFKTKIGLIKITNIVKDGYGKGWHKVYTTIDGGKEYADDHKEIKEFINENI